MKPSNLDLHVFLCSLRIQCINVIARLNLLVLLCSICVRSCFTFTVNPVLSGKSKGRPKIGFQDRLSLTAGLKYCRILQYFRPVLSYFKAFVLSIFEWLLKTCFTEHVPRWGRESSLLYFDCLLDIVWMLVFCVSSLRCRVMVCSL